MGLHDEMHFNLSMRRFAVWSLVLNLLSHFPAFAGEWFVSPGGNDAWSGRLPTPNAERSDGPVASLERARDVVRNARAAGEQGVCVVSVRGGIYEMKEALKLEAQDSGTPEAPVRWRAYPGETPVLSGAVALDGWEVWKEGIYRAPLGVLASKRGGVRQLLVEGERQPLARYPNGDPANPIAGGWAFAGGTVWPMYADKPGEDKRTLEVLEKDLRSWAKPAQVEIVVYPRFNWWNSRARVKSVDSAARTVTLAEDCSYAIRKGDRYFFQNALEELDAPGEWVADLEEGMLYFWPPVGKRPESARVVVAPSLLIMRPGTHDVEWSGLTLEGTDGNAVLLERTERCVLDGNHLRNVGDWRGNGVTVVGGKGNRIRYNTIEKVGSTGIFLGGGDVATLTPGDNVAEHNRVEHFGVDFKQGVGISLSGVGNRALHNHIHHGPRFGVMHGGNRNEIAWNHIHDVCLETEDTGAIYSGGRDWITPRGSRICYNWIHDVPGFSMHEGRAVTPHFAWGIYLDDNSGGVDVFGNIVARCGRGGMHGHGARDCVVQNNIFFGNKDWQVDFHGWSILQTFWERHLPTMVKGYESVVQQPAWREMRGMDLHPKDAPLPDGLTMRGNRFEKNLVVSSAAEVPVLSILRVPFSHNVFESNLYWAPGGQVRTGFRKAGPDEGPQLVPALQGSFGEMPQGWRFISKTRQPARAVLRFAEDGSGVRLQIVCEANGDGRSEEHVLTGGEMTLEAGATYRFRARVRSEKPGRMTMGCGSAVPRVYSWQTGKGEVEVASEWREREWIWDVPAQGSPEWNAQMKTFFLRLGWRSEGGTLELENLRMHRVQPRSEWEAWQANGADRHGIVADPLWEDPERLTLRADSPAWQLGFERIPVEQIGPQPRRP
jgi:parallel beta-helix repeat protein